MKAPSSAVWSAHHHWTESLALYLWACSLDNGIRWPWLCISSIWAACYRNAPSLLHKKYKIETEWCYQLFETDSSIHVSSTWTLNITPLVQTRRHEVISGRSTTHAYRTVYCTARTAKRIAHLLCTFQIRPQQITGIVKWNAYMKIRHICQHLSAQISPYRIVRRAEHFVNAKHPGTIGWNILQMPSMLQYKESGTLFL